MSKSTTAALVAKLVPQPDELQHESTTDIAHMVESLGYAIDQLTLGCYSHETSNAIGGLAEAVSDVSAYGTEATREPAPVMNRN